MTSLDLSVAAIALRLVGAFYVFAGFFIGHVVITGHFADQARRLLTGEKATRADSIKLIWSFILSLVVFSGGLALAVLLDFAPWLFIAGTILQVVYLIWIAPPVGAADGDVDPQGRKQTKNALIFYTAATLAVFWGWQGGRLISWPDASTLARGIFAAGYFAFVAYMAWGMNRAPRPSTDDATHNDDPPFQHKPVDPKAVRKIRVLATAWEPPLFAMDEDNLGSITPEAMGISEKLTRDLYAWSKEYAAYEEISADASTDKTYARLSEQGRALAMRLAGERPDLAVYYADPEAGMVQVHSSGAA